MSPVNAKWVHQLATSCIWLKIICTCSKTKQKTSVTTPVWDFDSWTMYLLNASLLLTPQIIVSGIYIGQRIQLHSSAFHRTMSEVSNDHASWLPSTTSGCAATHRSLLLTLGHGQAVSCTPKIEVGCQGLSWMWRKEVPSETICWFIMAPNRWSIMRFDHSITIPWHRTVLPVFCLLRHGFGFTANFISMGHSSKMYSDRRNINCSKQMQKK